MKVVVFKTWDVNQVLTKEVIDYYVQVIKRSIRRALKENMQEKKELRWNKFQLCLTCKFLFLLKRKDKERQWTKDEKM